MAYSLTVAGYTFENPPEEYRKLARLSNSPQTAFNRRSTAFFQSDSQDLQFQVEGTLALDPPLGETQDDADELERLQEMAIEGGEVDVEFDPFFSGKAVIADDPFRQAEGESSYQFTFTVNSESTDDSAYPGHSTPDTGNTFELGDMDLGYDPSEVSQNYERQTEKVKRLQGIARTVDTEGLIPKVTISGRIDGGGQATLWDKARSNTLAYLSAEFQNGWVLMDSLSIRNAPEAPDYLTGLFQYDMDLLVVMDPASGIGEVSKYVDQDVKGSTEYVSNCDDDGVLERLGNDTEDYPYALDYRISGGTGKLNGEYLEWQEDFGTLDQSTTNYIWVEDPDGNGYGQVNTGTSGFPGNTVPLYEVDTSTSSVDAIRDQRVCLTGSRLEPEDLGDLNFLSDLSVDDRLDFERVMALPPDSLAVSDPIERWLGLADLTESLAVAEGPLDARASQPFPVESPNLLDGGTAIGTGGGGGQAFLTWGDEADDWDTFTSNAGMAHESVANTDHGDATALVNGYSYENPTPQPGNLVFFYPFDEDDADTLHDVSGNGNDATDITGGMQPNQPGILGTTAWDSPNGGSNGGDHIGTGVTSSAGSGEFAFAAWVYPRNIPPDTNYEATIASTYNSNSESGGWIAAFEDDGYRFWLNGDNNQPANVSAVQNNTWLFVVFQRVSGNAEIWTDANLTNSISSSANVSTSSDDITFFTRNENQDGLDAKIAAAWYWEGTGLTDTEIQAMYDVGVRGSHQTATKSFAAPSTPDISTANYTLNGQSGTITVVGSPGTASEESQQVTLDGSSSFSLSWNSGHTDFQISVDITVGDLTAQAVINTVELEGSTSSSDTDQNPQTSWEIRGAEYDTSGNEYEGGGVISRYGAD